MKYLEDSNAFREYSNNVNDTCKNDDTVLQIRLCQLTGNYKIEFKDSESCRRHVEGCGI